MRAVEVDGQRLPTRPTDAVVEPFLRSRKSRAKHDPRDLAALASWYVLQVYFRDRNPAATLADLYPETSIKTWANIFNKARNHGLLSLPPRRGVAGGELTDLGWDLLLGDGLSDDESDTLNMGLEFGPAALRVHTVKGSVISDDELADEIVDEKIRKARHAMGEYSAGEREAARRRGELPELYQQAKRQRARHEKDVRDYYLRKIRECSTVDELRRLWASGSDVLVAESDLMDAWKARGRQLQKPG